MKHSIHGLALAAACILVHPAIAEEEKGAEYDRCVHEAQARLDDCKGRTRTSTEDQWKQNERGSTCMERWEDDVADCDRTYKG